MLLQSYVFAFVKEILPYKLFSSALCDFLVTVKFRVTLFQWQNQNLFLIKTISWRTATVNRIFKKVFCSLALIVILVLSAVSNLVCSFFAVINRFGRYAVQKIYFSIKDFFIKCDQIRSFLWIWSHLLKKP